MTPLGRRAARFVSRSGKTWEDDRQIFATLHSTNPRRAEARSIRFEDDIESFRSSF